MSSIPSPDPSSLDGGATASQSQGAAATLGAEPAVAATSEPTASLGATRPMGQTDTGGRVVDPAGALVANTPAQTAEAPARQAVSSPAAPVSQAAPKTRRAKRSAENGTGSAKARTKLRPDDGRLARGRRSRARIRAAALSLFRERGFDGATLRAIAERAEMGASSIYRHVQSKEELLIDELSAMQEEAWTRFRSSDDRNLATAERLRAFFDAQHDLLVENRDLTTIALRATTKTEARVAKRVLQLYDRTIGLLMEILQQGRMKRHLAKDVDVLETARVLFHVTNGARIPWANGMVDDDALRNSTHQAVNLLFRGVSAEAR